jgi:hypothetical protein
MIVVEMNSSQVETQSEYNPDVCSGLHSELEQKSAEYPRKMAEHDQETAEYASATQMVHFSMPISEGCPTLTLNIYCNY